MPGHLFVVQGDLTRLACDAWLLPTGRGLQIRSHWLRGAPADLLQRVTRSHDPMANIPSALNTWVFDGLLNTPSGWYERLDRTFEIEEWVTDDGQHRPWATQIVVPSYWSSDDKARWIADGAVEFVQQASQSLRGRAPAYGRHKHLLALPVVGTGRGGGWASAGAILQRLLPELQAAVDEVDADVVLVTNLRDQYAAAQHARRLMPDATRADNPWASIPDDLKMVGQSLADQSARGRLVLFVGAGVSASAGLPTWQGLLSGLAGDAGFDRNELKALANLPAVDQARLVRDRLEEISTDSKEGGALAAAICERVTSDRYGLTHALLANLSIAEVVTTNYDTLFERASRDADYTTAVLPYEPTEDGSRWLLKMHGCVEHPSDIVLTREDYLRYAERRGALAAIVQAMLITRHMLFVGFSLNDDNFQRIADEVRKVMRTKPSETSSGPGPFGTALLLKPSTLLASLWQRDIRCISIQSRNGQSMSSVANELEILLDYVLFQAKQNVSHLMDQRYDDLLSKEERCLRDLLVKLESDATPTLTQLPAWRLVSDLLKALGHRPPSQPHDRQR